LSVTKATTSKDSEAEDSEFALQAAELAHLRPLRDALLAAGDNLAVKEDRINADTRVVAFVAANGPVARVLSNIATEDAFLLKCCVAIGQSHVLEVSTQDPISVVNALAPLVKTLRNVEVFYDMLGGLVVGTPYKLHIQLRPIACESARFLSTLGPYEVISWFQAFAFRWVNLWPPTAWGTSSRRWS
jgi:hypothetical protein